ncbi:alpha/beta fold hydrolase [Halosimplex salinum]|uniref:alpha/beta fold hydrolase n=1 Tax=Halosimplex salinum TaxID=1710538 RepID=UPI000F4A70D5|nr:alpha/beta hydrolase [Halosimplex salinum]
MPTVEPVDSGGGVDGRSDGSSETESAETVEYGGEGRRLCYAEYGDPNGEPLIFLHGTPGSRVLGALYDEAATTQGVRVIAPDRPGFGRSSPWPGRRATDVDGWAEPLLAEADVSTARVVAFSGGSADALALAATRGSLVERVDLVSGAPPPSVAAETPRLQRGLGRVAARTPALLAAGFRGQAWLAARGSPSTVIGQYTEDPAEIPETDAELVARDFVESCRESRNGVVTELAWVVDDWGVSVGDVDCPVRLWHGERDENVPVGDAERLSDRLPDGRLTTLDADHLTALLSSPDLVLGPVGPRD